MKKPIRIKFVDFWDDFVPEQSLFYQLLSQKYEIELTDNPDYLFCSVFGDEHLRYDCVKIFYTGENQCPDFNLYDYAIGFERLTLGDRYFRLPIYYLYANDFAAMQAKHETVSLDGKEHFCSFVYSNNNASPHREAFLNKLNEYQTVSSGGRYRNNVGGPVADKLQFQLTHKFSIAFENSSYPGYCTEKLVQSFAARTIPIYWGRFSFFSQRLTQSVTMPKRPTRRPLPSVCTAHGNTGRRPFLSATLAHRHFASSASR